MGEEAKGLSREWPACVACADVKIAECGGVMVKRGQKIASAPVIHKRLVVGYPELKACGPLVKKAKSAKEEDAFKELALAKGSYELFGAEEAKAEVAAEKNEKKGK